MQLIGTLTNKHFSTLIAGELFRFSFGRGLGLALCIEPQGEQGKGIYGSLIVAPEDSSQPFTWWRNHLDGHCVSYGTDWLLEVEPGDETAPNNQYRHEKSFNLFLDVTGLVMRFQSPSGNSFESIEFNLQSLTRDHLTPNAAPVLRWSIWDEMYHSRKGGISKPIYLHESKIS